MPLSLDCALHRTAVFRKTDCRIRRPIGMETLSQDVKHSLRLLRQHPAFTLTALAALTLGIGTNTAIFSVVNSVLLKPAPFPEPERLVLFLLTSPQGSGPGASPTKFQNWREQTSVVEDVSAFRTGVVNLTGNGFPEQLQSAQVSADFFRLFGAATLRGRTFTPEEDLPKADKVVVLSHGLWTRRFGSDPQIIGKTISLGGDPHQVIGILPRIRFSRLRPASRRVRPVPTRSPSHRSGTLFLGRGPAEARRHARAGERAHETFRRGFPPQVSRTCCRLIRASPCSRFARRW